MTESLFQLSGCLPAALCLTFPVWEILAEFLHCAQDFQVNNTIYDEDRMPPKKAQQIPGEFCDSANSAHPWTAHPPPFVSAHLIPFLSFILILFGSKGQQNISKAKQRGAGSSKETHQAHLKLSCSKVHFATG